ncbi:GntR family transcriptional regulator [Actinomycetospora cinnamomea]|uniref:GntR family transcriptional regulator n=1 Tax=Actinomycetospora cinnamomea TaxID=663609 RepID=UPI000E31130E|nr:GntR family transcriptional regulator [Actinomycetospora cinnamomea]
MPKRAVDRQSPVPLWSQVQDDLRRRLSEGEFDTVFPGENALVTDYDVSRNTVREALRGLRAEGLVTAERGRAPRVRRAEIEQPVGTLYSLFASVEAAGLTQRSDVRVLDVRADGVVAAHLGLEESTPLVHLERLRRAGDAPLAVDRVWLPATVAAPLLDADFTHTSLYTELAARTGTRLESGHERISAQVPTEGERKLLECGEDVAVFVIERTGIAQGRPLEWRQTIVRGDRFAFDARFSARGLHLAVAPPAPPPSPPPAPVMPTAAGT